MNKFLKKGLIVLIIIAVISGLGFGGFKIYGYIIDKERENAEYTSIPMLFDYAEVNPLDFYVSRNVKEDINLTSLLTDKEKIINILQVSDYNYLNSMYLGKYRKGETLMTVTINKPLSETDPSNDAYLISNVKTQMFELFNYETTFLNKDGLLSPLSYDQNVFYMQDFVNEGKDIVALNSFLPMAMDALNKGNYYLIYDKVYWKTLKYPKYIEATDTFELTDNQTLITDFETMGNGNINHLLDPLISFFPFEITDAIISNDNLSYSYDTENNVYNIGFSVNTDVVDQAFAEAYMINLLTFTGGKLLNYSANAEIWDSGLLKSITETYTYDVIYDAGFLTLYMQMPFTSTTYFSYNEADADVESKLSIFNEG